MELQLIDRKTHDLTATAMEVFELLGSEGPRIKPELFQAMIELNTGICRTIDDVRRDLTDTLARLRQVTSKLGVEFASSGSHPFAKHRERILYPAERYQALIDRNRWIAQRLMIFGLHVHVGMRDGDHAIAMMNAISHYYPHLLALSASSPFWQGSDTGLASSRITIFEALPTAGHPCLFTDWEGFEAFYDAMVRSRAIKNVKDIWWDIRPHPDFGTLEIRVCDALPTLSETLALVSLTHCLLTWLDGEYREGKKFAPPPDWILRENKWRASRWGIEAEIVVDAAGRTRPLHEDIPHLLHILEPIASGNGCKHELFYIEEMLRVGLSYQRQRKVFKQSSSFEEVVSSLIDEFATDKLAIL